MHFSVMSTPAMAGLRSLLVFSFLRLSCGEEDRISVYPRILTRTKRESTLEGDDGDIQVEVRLGARPLHLLLAENQALSLAYGVVEWVHPNGSVTKEPILNVLKEKQEDWKRGEEEEDKESRPEPSCFYAGSIQGEESSLGNC